MCTRVCLWMIIISVTVPCILMTDFCPFRSLCPILLCIFFYKTSTLRGSRGTTCFPTRGRDHFRLTPAARRERERERERLSLAWWRRKWDKVLEIEKAKMALLSRKRRIIVEWPWPVSHQGLGEYSLFSHLEQTLYRTGRRRRRRCWRSWVSGRSPLQQVKHQSSMRTLVSPGLWII